MPRYRRSPFTFFAVEEDTLLHIDALFAGRLEESRAIRLFALSPLTATKRVVSPDDLNLLLRVPADRWSSEDELADAGLPAKKAADLALRALLLSDADEPPFSRWRRRAETLEESQWHPWAALYHFLTRDAERHVTGELIDYAALESEAADRALRFVELHGPPPEPFHVLGGIPRIDLPLRRPTGALHEILGRRRTTRAFDTTTKMELADLSTLLYSTFGCHGYTHLSPEVLLLHRTSPSGGSRHPVEAYPLVLSVEGVATGLYHYDMRDHALELVREYDLEQARELAVEAASGQGFAGSAHVLVIMTARFYSNYWKYRRRARTYSVIMMDIGHLSQTFYLVATDLDLGVFYTAAVDSPRIDEELGLDGYEESAVALCGCGIKRHDGSDHGLPFQPYAPRRTKLRP